MSARLSSAQSFVLKDMHAKGFFWLRGNYATTRYALQRKGLIAFSDARGMYEMTDAGRAAIGVTP